MEKKFKAVRQSMRKFLPKVDALQTHDRSLCPCQLGRIAPRPGQINIVTVPPVHHRLGGIPSRKQPPLVPCTRSTRRRANPAVVGRPTPPPTAPPAPPLSDSAPLGSLGSRARHARRLRAPGPRRFSLARSAAVTRFCRLARAPQ